MIYYIIQLCDSLYKVKNRCLLLIKKFFKNMEYFHNCEYKSLILSCHCLGNVCNSDTFLTKCSSDREVRGSCIKNLSIFSFNEWISSQSWHNVFNDCSEERVGLKEKFTPLSLDVNVLIGKKLNRLGCIRPGYVEFTRVLPQKRSSEVFCGFKKNTSTKE